MLLVHNPLYHHFKCLFSCPFAVMYANIGIFQPSLQLFWAPESAYLQVYMVWWHNSGSHWKVTQKALFVIYFSSSSACLK